MNTALRPVVIFLILLVTALPVIAATRGAVSIASIEGHVDYIPAAPGRTVTAKPNTSLKEGDAVEVPGPGNAEMVTRDGSIVRISGGSRLKVLSIENNAVQLFLESGRAYVKYPGLKGHPLFLNSPSAELDAFDPAIFRADITPSGDTEVSVYSGQLYIAQPKGRMTIIAGTRLVMKKDGGDPVYTTNRPADAWDEWNRKKDGPQPAEKGSPSDIKPPAGDNALPPAAYPPPPAVPGGSYIYAVPAPYWGYSYYYYPWGYRPYPWRWYGPYYPGWGPRPWYGRYYGYRGRPYGPGPYPYHRPPYGSAPYRPYKR
jgi:hypothetical protein